MGRTLNCALTWGPIGDEFLFNHRALLVARYAFVLATYA